MSSQQISDIQPSNQPVVTAAMLAIGDELLSGRTKDKNIGHLADVLTMAGIDLKEVRIVADDEDAIVTAVNQLRSTYDYVFTSGGIGPTHDDITADAISKAFELPCEHDAKAMALLGAMYERRGVEFTEARQRMARMPKGAAHIENKVSTAPGFIIGNVYVMAGVPQVFIAMVEAILPTLRTGGKMLSTIVLSPFGEGDIGIPLGIVQKDHPNVVIGSYPKFDGKSFSTDIVIRSRSQDDMESARQSVELMLTTIRDSKDAAHR